MPRAEMWVALTLVLGVSLAVGCADNDDDGGGGGIPVTAPTGLAANGGTGQVTLTWDPVVGAKSYNIYWSTTPGVTRSSGTRIQKVQSPHTEFGLANGTTYYFIVTAKGKNESPPSAEVSAQPVEAPSNLMAWAGSTEASLSWTDVPGATSYNVYWSTSPGVTRKTGKRVTGVANPGLVSGLANGIPHYFAVAAANDVGDGAESDLSNEAAATPENLGFLDTTFGGRGWITAHDAAGGAGDDRGEAVAVDSAGRILVAGTSAGAGTGMDMVLWCFDETGAPDPLFGTRGVAIHDGAAGGNGDDWAHDLVLDGGDRIIAVGQSENAAGDFDMAIWRFTPWGIVDTTFGFLGVFSHDDAAGGTGNDIGLGVALDAGGAIVVAGSSENAAGDMDQAIWKVDTTGALDSGFGMGGFVTDSDVVAAGEADSGASVALDDTGRILVAGWSGDTGADRDLVVWAYDATGTLDAGFATGGRFIHHDAAGGGDDDQGNDILFIPVTGQIFVAGSSDRAGADQDLAIWVLDGTGALDASWGTSGIVTHDNAAGGTDDDLGESIVRDDSGQIFVAGASRRGAGNFDMALWAYDPTGALIASFGRGGVLTHHNAAGGNGEDTAQGIALDGLHRIVAAGWSARGGNFDLAVWRVR